MPKQTSLGSQWLEVSQRRATAARTAVRLAANRLARPLFPVVGGGAHVTQGPRAGHVGLDIGATAGSAVVVPVAGIISREQHSGSGYGTAVWMIDPVSGRELTFGHLLSEFVHPGQRVAAGERIGEVGSTGHSTGPHLHFEVGQPGEQGYAGQSTEVSAVDPLAWLQGAAPAVAAASGFSSRSAVVAAPSGMSTTTPSPQTAPQQAAPQQAAAYTTPSGARAYQGAGLGAAAVASGAVAARQPTGIQAIVDGITANVKRAGFVGAGLLLVLLGIGIFAFSYKDQIATTGAKLVGTAVGSAAGNPAAGAGLVTAAVMPP